jgi:endonuclease YncB( thermonuclease family)
MVAGQNKGRSVFAIFGDALNSGPDSVLAQSVARNSGQIFAHLVSLMDVFLVLGVVLAIVALIAFTPGDALEKALRPFMYGLIGAVGGGVLAVMTVALGFTPPVSGRPYAADLTRENIQSGDTFWIGEQSLQLYGVDAPESGQLCISGGGIFLDCGEIAREKLAELASARPVTCVAANAPRNVPADMGARALVTCAIVEPTGPVDLGRRLVAEGIATPFPGLEKDYAKETAAGAALGITRYCTLKPASWRTQPAYVKIFTDRDTRKLREIPAAHLTAGCRGRV